MPTFYQTLEINNDADEKDIKKGYRKQALKYHPDVSTMDKTVAEERFKEVAYAYEHLSDKDKRMPYDAWLKVDPKHASGDTPYKPNGPNAPGPGAPAQGFAFPFPFPFPQPMAGGGGGVHFNINMSSGAHTGGISGFQLHFGSAQPPQHPFHAHFHQHVPPQQQQQVSSKQRKSMRVENRADGTRVTTTTIEHLNDNDQVLSTHTQTQTETQFGASKPTLT